MWKYRGQGTILKWIVLKVLLQVICLESTEGNCVSMLIISHSISYEAWSAYYEQLPEADELMRWYKVMSQQGTPCKVLNYHDYLQIESN